jgi:hypothetical protein
MVEHAAVNRRVVGSSPTRGANLPQIWPETAFQGPGSGFLAPVMPPKERGSRRILSESGVASVQAKAGSRFRRATCSLPGKVGDVSELAPHGRKASGLSSSVNRLRLMASPGFVVARDSHFRWINFRGQGRPSSQSLAPRRPRRESLTLTVVQRPARGGASSLAFYWRVFHNPAPMTITIIFVHDPPSGLRHQ